MITFVLEIFRVFCLSIGAMLAYQCIWNFNTYLKSKQKWVLNQSMLCFFSFLFCSSIFIVGLGFKSKELYSVFGLMNPLWGVLAYHFYISVMQDHLEFKIKGHQFIKGLIASAVGILFLTYLLATEVPSKWIGHIAISNTKNLYLSSNTYLYEFGIIYKVIMGMLMLSTVYTSTLFLKRILSIGKDYFLLIGVFLTLLLGCNDVILTITRAKFLVPLSFSSNFIEISLLSYAALRGSTRRMLELEGEVIEVSKIAEVGAMAGQICHDIRNPLTIITGYCRQLLRSLDSGKEPSQIKLDRMIGKIRNSTLRISHIIHDYLAFMQDDNQSKPEPINIYSAVQSAIDMNHSKLTKVQAKIDINIQKDLHVLMHENRLVMIFTNLISNASDAIAELDERWIKIDGKLDENSYCIYFTDSGSGISKDIIAKIFERQFTTKKEGVGTGLGLSFVKTVLNHYQYSIEYNHKNSNTEFVITIPVENISVIEASPEPIDLSAAS